MAHLLTPGDVLGVGGAALVGNPMRLAQALAHAGVRGLTAVCPHPGPALTLLAAHGALDSIVVLDGTESSEWLRLSGDAKERISISSADELAELLNHELRPTLTLLNVPTAEEGGWIAPSAMWDVRLAQSSRHLIATAQSEQRTPKSMAAEVLISARGCWPTAATEADRPDGDALAAFRSIGRIEMLEAPL